MNEHGEKEVDGMPLKFAYETAWNGGMIRVEAPSLDELSKIIKNIRETDETPRTQELGSDGGIEPTSDYPNIGGNTGCADALRALLASDWGRAEPRTEAELTEAMKANAVHYQRGTISGLLTNLTRRGQLRRVGKKLGSYAYAINRTKETEITS